MWMLLALLTPAFYAAANIVDNYLVSKKFSNPISITFYSFLFNLFFAPLIIVFTGGIQAPTETIPIFILLGFINIAYLYPYYKGLQNDDTSTAVSFFALGRIFIPIWAFLIVGESLTFYQYIGILLIVVASILVSLKRQLLKMKMSKAFWFIGVSAFFTSFEGVLIKHLLDQGVSVGTAIGGEMIISFMFSLLLLLSFKTRKTILKDFKIFKSVIGIFAIEEFFTFLAFAIESYVISLAPVSPVKSITLFTPFFLLLYAKAFSKKFPKFFSEKVSAGPTLRKIILFTCMIIGAMLIGS